MTIDDSSLQTTPTNIHSFISNFLTVFTLSPTPGLRLKRERKKKSLSVAASTFPLHSSLRQVHSPTNNTSTCPAHLVCFQDSLVTAPVLYDMTLYGSFLHTVASRWHHGGITAALRSSLLLNDITPVFKDDTLSADVSLPSLEISSKG